MTALKKLFRRNASDTSIDAAKSLPVTRLEQIVLDEVRKRKAHGITADELLSALPNLSYSSVTARPASLKEKGLIVDSGERREGRSSRKQAVLVAKEFWKGE